MIFSNNLEKIKVDLNAFLYHVIAWPIILLKNVDVVQNTHLQGRIFNGRLTSYFHSKYVVESCDAARKRWVGFIL